MTSQGVTKLLLTITRAYPSYKPSDMQSTAQLWFNLLKGFTDQEIAVALNAYIVSDKKGFPPAIGQIIDLIPKKRAQLAEMEAWTLVNKAIKNGIYGAEKEFNKLPRTVRIAVGSPGQLREWAMIEIDDLQTVAQSNFLRSYRAAAERERQIDAMPEEYKHLYSVTEPVANIEAADETEKDETTGVPMPDTVKRRLENLWKY